MRFLPPLFKNKRFLYLMFSQLLSVLIINMLSFLILLKLYDQTESSIATSLLWITYAIPALLVGPFAAALVDYVDRRTVLVISNLLQSLTILFYAFTPDHRYFFSYAVVFIYSFFNQFYTPAEAAMLPIVTDKKHLPQANGIFFLTSQGALVIGFGLAGILYELLGFRTTLVFASLGLFLAFVSVSLLPSEKKKSVAPSNVEKTIADFFDRILEGYRFIKNRPLILYPLVLLVIVQVLLSVIMVNLPTIATSILSIRPGLSGLVIVAPAGIGAVVGTFVVTRLLSQGKRKKHLIESSLYLIGGSLFLTAVYAPFVPAFMRLPLAILFFFIAGFGFVQTLVPSLTLMQEATPGGYMGRVFGNFWFLTTLCTILPVIFSGTITELFNIQILLFFIVGICISAGLLSRRFSRKVALA
jgi:MFS family permease